MATASSSTRRGSTSSSGSSSDASLAGVDLNPDTEWQDIEPDVDKISYISLVDDEIFTDLSEMLEHCRISQNVDILGAIKKYDLEFYDCVKLINYLRTSKPPFDLSSKSTFSSDTYLQPALEDDTVLISIDELLALAQPQEETEESTTEDISTSLAQKYRALQEAHSTLQSQYAAYRETVSSTLSSEWTSRPTTHPPARTATEDAEDGYFESYSYNDIHETMLKDALRTSTYRDFIYTYKHLSANKTILDVGAGTSILSMFAARAGAAHVFAVDNSAIIHRARAIVHANGLDSVISCVHGKIETVSLPWPPSSPKKVDLIISEWMGYALLYEAMLPSVLVARDTYLAKDGIMAPSHATLRLAPLSDNEFAHDALGFWGDVYGFDMRAMQSDARSAVLIRSVPINALAGDSVEAARFDLRSVSAAELEFTNPFEMTLSRDIDVLHGFVIWFDTFFLPSPTGELPVDARAEDWTSTSTKYDERRGVGFSTGPFAKSTTHWASAVLLVEEKDEMWRDLKKGDRIRGSLQYAKSKDLPRELDISLSWEVVGREGAKGRMGRQTWMLK